jgi:hypothetical protein
MIRRVYLLVLALAACGLSANAQSGFHTAATCNSSDVQTAINAAAEGDTVIIPAGTCSWTSGVSISGKGITVQGAGSGRIIAYDNGTEVLTVGTGTKTIAIAGFSPGFSGSSFTAGTTLRISQTGNRSAWMQGTVTSFSGSTLTMNVTSTAGSGATHRWIVSTIPSTVLLNDSATAMFTVAEDTSFHTNLSGFKIAASSGASDGVDFNSNSNGVAILLHDCWIEQSKGDSINSNTNRGVVWNCSFDSSPFSMEPIAYHMKNGPVTSWTTADTMGMNDTDGQHNFYIESSDFHAYLNATDNDDNGRLVFRYNLMDNAGFGTHGADTSTYGQRYFEFYNNTGVFNAYNDGTTFNLNWWMFVRGGTYVAHHNTLPALQSTDYGTKSDITLTVMNLQRNAGPNPCWGSGTLKGVNYHAPRQVGMGRLTGAGKDGLGRTADTATYVGDIDPAYSWANSRQPLANIGVSDYGAGNTDSCTGPTETSANYIVLNRDYFNGSTPKPAYTPYTFPHPLTNLSTSQGPSLPNPPTGLNAIIQ